MTLVEVLQNANLTTEEYDQLYTTLNKAYQKSFKLWGFVVQRAWSVEANAEMCDLTLELNDVMRDVNAAEYA